MTFSVCVFKTLRTLFRHLCSYSIIKLRGDSLQIPNLIPFEIESWYFFQENCMSHVILLLKVALIMSYKQNETPFHLTG